MRLLNILRLRLRSLLSRETLDSDLDEELRYHLARQTEEDIAIGHASRRSAPARAARSRRQSSSARKNAATRAA